MEKLTQEQYTQLRQKGLSQSEIRDVANRGKVYETLNKKTFKEKGLLRSTAGFLGMEEFGRGIGTAIGNFKGTQDTVMQGQQRLQKAQTDLLKKIKEGRAQGKDTSRLEAVLQQMAGAEQGVADDMLEVGTQGLSNREVIGSAIQTGLTAGSLLGFGPTAKGVGAVTGLTGGGITGAVARGAVAGGLSGGAFGGAEAITEGTAVAGGVAKGASFGAVVGGVTSGIGQYISDLSKTTPKSRLVDQKDALVTLKKKFNENSVYKVVDGKKQLISDPITTITDTGVGSKLKVVDGKIQTDVARAQLREMIQSQADEVTQAVQNPSVASVPMSEFKEEAIATAKKSLKGTGKTTATINKMNSYFDDFADDFAKVAPETAKTMNGHVTMARRVVEQPGFDQSQIPQVVAQAKQNMILSAQRVGLDTTKLANSSASSLDELAMLADDYLDEASSQISTANISFIREQMNKSYNPDTVDVERAIGDTARKFVYRNAPGAQKALAREGQLIGADKFLDALDGRAVKGGRLGGYFANLLGAIAGSTTNVPVVGPVAGALGANKVQSLMQSQQLNPIAPQMARGLTSMIDRLPTDTAGNISKTAVMNLIGQLSAQQSSGQNK